LRASRQSPWSARSHHHRREVTYGFGELDELVLAYATTIHKSQGSEYPAVVIPLSTQHYPMLERNLVYTGVTRGKRLVVLVGQRKALAIAVKGVRAGRRWSKLRAWLIDMKFGSSEKNAAQID
jgi:exodeoxyribonuclease V alpha subunit